MEMVIGKPRKQTNDESEEDSGDAEGDGEGDYYYDYYSSRNKFKGQTSGWQLNALQGIAEKACIKIDL